MDMDNRRLPGDARAESPRSRKPYSPPKLTIYGSVKDLVRASTSTQRENSNCNPFWKGRTGQCSDRRAKEEIVRIGEHPLGIGVYLFKYKPAFRDAWGHGRRFGVMADEVEAVMPDAVSVHRDGYKVVDYGRLGMSPTDSGVRPGAA